MSTSKKAALPGTFPERLAFFRAEKGWTAAKLDREARLPVSSTTTYEQHGAEPKLRSLMLLAEALGVTVGELVDGCAMPPDLQTRRATTKNG
jgi:transcriptional regulator with XRE-family HTH domain